jgi:hypothetical protein
MKILLTPCAGKKLRKVPEAFISHFIRLGLYPFPEVLAVCLEIAIQ